MEKTIGVIIVALIVFLGWAFVKQANNNAQFSSWATECLEDGGITTLTKTGFTSEHWECVKDGKIINHVN